MRSCRPESLPSGFRVAGSSLERAAQKYFIAAEKEHLSHKSPGFLKKKK
jgi:hypothetical protein